MASNQIKVLSSSVNLRQLLGVWKVWAFVVGEGLDASAHLVGVVISEEALYPP